MAKKSLDLAPKEVYNNFILQGRGKLCAVEEENKLKRK